MCAKILIIDDNEEMGFLVSTILKGASHIPIVTTNPTEGLKAAYEHQPDLVVLDIMMPGMDGLEVARRLRTVSEVPIIFISGGKNQVEDIIAGLDTGGNDYLIKPFNQAEFLARVEAQLRRYKAVASTAPKAQVSHNFQINFEERRVSIAGKYVPLSGREFELLEILVRNAEKAVTREDLTKAIWGTDDESAEASLKVYISSLRRKIERNASYPEMIVTVRGTGYRFQLPPD